VCEREVRWQLAPWILVQHPHELARYVASLPGGLDREARLAALNARYGLPALALAPFAEL
jgi:hypothetical protein